MLCFKSAICIFIGSVIFFQKCSLQNTHILYFKVIYKLSLLQNLQNVFKTRWSSQTLCFLIAYQDSRAKKKKKKKTLHYSLSGLLSNKGSMYGGTALGAPSAVRVIPGPHRSTIIHTHIYTCVLYLKQKSTVCDISVHR